MYSAPPGSDARIHGSPFPAITGPIPRSFNAALLQDGDEVRRLCRDPLLQRTHLILQGAHLLEERLRRLGNAVQLVPHGVDLVLQVVELRRLRAAELLQGAQPVLQRRHPRMDGLQLFGFQQGVLTLLLCDLLPLLLLQGDELQLLLLLLQGDELYGLRRATAAA